MKTLVVLTGQLRCINNFFSWYVKQTVDSDLIVVTDSDQESLLKEYNHLIYKKYFIDEDEYQKNLMIFLHSIDEGNKLLQWQKLYYSFIECGLTQGKYDNVIRVRSDIDYSSFTLLDRKITPGSIYMYTDYIFCFSYDDYKYISEFFLHSLTKYYDDAESLKIDSLDILKRNDLRAGRFEWLVYPNTLTDYYPNFSELARSLDLIQGNELDFSSGNSSYRLNYKDIKFPSESAFVHYLASNQYFRLKLIQKLTLLPERLAYSYPNLDFSKRYSFSELEKKGTVTNNPEALKDISKLFEVRGNYHMALYFIYQAYVIRPEGNYIKSKFYDLKFKYLHNELL
ncbi:hypothetical protein [Vibrio sp. 1CM23M]|uniref:hypothetical protein n=1 Tax=Vibrio sp. 1CM23M TaxID=2929164 RepID=UPI0020BF5C0E|nr:hypothetical protein [Vibrio sp. 1CM23M]MCK8073697.1 hypothetical protein [Vibrio sp. 1CM23M]